MKQRVVLSGLIIGILLLVPLNVYSRQESSLEYSVNVEARIIPVFAVDEKGEPIYDIVLEELQLLVDEKPWEIAWFSSYRAGMGETGAVAPTVAVKPKTPERIHFIIMDALSNTFYGVKRAREVMIGLVQNGSPGDAFVLLSVSPGVGFRYLLGPTKNKKNLLAAISGLQADPQWTTAATLIRDLKPELWEIIQTQSHQELSDILQQYSNEMGGFMETFNVFKNALKTTNLPKTVFLISGGVQEISGHRASYNKSVMRGYAAMLQGISKMVNTSGALFFAVNPMMEDARFKDVFRAMDKATNGNCLSGKDSGEILSKIKNRTAAYYELAFSPPQNRKSPYRLNVKCNRPGIKINTLHFDERPQPYSFFSEEQKKLFALNIVNGGSWSRTTGSLDTTACLVNSSSDQGTERLLNVNIYIPDDFLNRPIESFTVDIDPVSMIADIKFSKIAPTRQPFLNMEIKNRKNRKLYVVVIDPEAPHCVYTPVI